MTCWNVKQPWVGATSCSSSCSIQAYPMQKNSHLRWLTLLSPLLILPTPDSIIWCSDPSNVIKELPTVGLPGDYFYSPMRIQGEWGPYTESICSLTRRVVAQMRRLQLLSANETVSCTCTKYYAYRDGYSDNTLLDILRHCKKYQVQKLVIETNFGDGIVAELFKTSSTD